MNPMQRINCKSPVEGPSLLYYRNVSLIRFKMPHDAFTAVPVVSPTKDKLASLTYAGSCTGFRLVHTF
jgi:hypothetical protein